MSLEERVASDIHRKRIVSPSVEAILETNIQEGGQDQIVEDSDTDQDFNCNQKTKRPKTVMIELPVDILSSPDVCSMLDRTGTSSRKAVGVISSVLKSGKVDGEKVDLQQFNLSHR